jgi:hypothetical protein
MAGTGDPSDGDCDLEDDHRDVECPAPVNDGAQTNEDTAVNIAVLANDVNPDNVLSVTSVGTPAHGSAGVNQDNTVTYTPALNYNGTDSFTYTVTDGTSWSGTATVTVTVAPVNDPPVAVDDIATTSKNQWVVVTVVANDTDVDGDSLTVSSITDPAHGSTYNHGQAITFFPDQDFVGTDTFSYTVSDGNGGYDTADVTVTVSGPPVANTDTYYVGAGQTLVISAPGVLTNDTAGPTATTQLLAGPFGGGQLTFNSNGSFTYTAPPSFMGGYFSYRIIENGVQSSGAQVNLIPGSPLTFAGPALPGGDVREISERQVQPYLIEAAQRLAVAGASAAELGAVLATTEIQVIDFSLNTLAVSGDNVIYLDADAAGNGWYLDPRPRSDDEFSIIVAPTERQAAAGDAPQGRVDLLTALMHELSHRLGDEHETVDPHDLMNPFLGAGVRRFSEPHLSLVAVSGEELYEEIRVAGIAAENDSDPFPLAIVSADFRRRFDAFMGVPFDDDEWELLLNELFAESEFWWR